MNVGFVLLAGATLFALLGVTGYIAARRSSSKSRYAALSLFGHGALTSSGAIAAVLFVRVDSLWPFQVHLQSVQDVIAQIMNCDWEVSCVAATILALVGLVLGTAFIVGQGSSRFLLRRYLALEDRPATKALLRRNAMRPRTRLLVVRDQDADAFSFAVVRFGGRRLLQGEDVIVITSALMGILADDEADAVLAHEAAHVEARDDRYLPFFHVLSTLLFFDPIVRDLKRRVARHHEFAADAESARVTRRPLSLARALLKLYIEGMPEGTASLHATGLSGRGSRAEIVERIEALVALDAAGLKPGP
jgi:Zn-dependent protease with chaperone function